MFQYKINLGLVLTVILSIWGCGTMAKDDDSLSVPQKVSIEIPKALESDSVKNEKRFKSSKTEESKSLAYLELKSDVQFLEEQRVNVEINLLFINEVILEVDTKCKTVEKEKVCLIPEDELTFVFNEALSKKLKTLSSENFAYEIGDILSFGEIQFVEHVSSNAYRYSLKMDTSFEEESTSSENISWSKDEKLILSDYIEESSNIKNSIKINFSQKEDNSRQIVVDDSFFDKIDNSSDSFHFEMLKKADTDETYELSSNSIAIDSDGKENAFFSVGQLSNLGGYLNFKGEFDGEVFRENDLFDANGDVLSSSYCYSGMNCDLEDEGSWFVD